MITSIKKYMENERLDNLVTLSRELDVRERLGNTGEAILAPFWQRDVLCKGLGSRLGEASCEDFTD